jgi:hypothetical protein
MSTLAEIESAARKLLDAQKQQLLVVLAQSLRTSGQKLPDPRRVSAAELQGWMDQDERDMEQFRGQR